MPLITSQVLPFPPSELQLSNPLRWKTLAPLMRSSATVLEVDGSVVLLDRSATSEEVNVVVMTRPAYVGELIPLLGVRGGVSGIVIVDDGEKGKEMKGKDVVEIVGREGVRDVVVLRVGKERRLEVLGDAGGAVEVVLEGESECAHLIALLKEVDRDVRKSLASTTELLKHFLKSETSTTTMFHSEKLEDDSIAIVHAGERQVFETATKAIERDLTKLLRAHARTAHESLDVTYSVHVSDVNGLSKLECWLLMGEMGEFLDAQSLQYRLSNSSLSTPSLDSRGYIISICPILRSLLPPTKPSTNPLSTSSSSPSATHTTSSPKPFSLFENFALKARITAGCNALIKEEPLITEYDTIVGDGDCGLTLRSGAEKVLSFIGDRDVSNLPAVLNQLVDDLEVTMGGTSGALYCIFLSSLSQSLSGISSRTEFPSALNASLQHLLRFTAARKGDRTLLDALIPFVDTLEGSGGDWSKALEEARKGVEGTKKMEAKLGRSTYLDEKATRGVPDPGAYGVLVLLEGLCGWEGR